MLSRLLLLWGSIHPSQLIHKYKHKQKHMHAQVHFCAGAGHGGTLDQRVQVLDILRGWKPARDLLLATNAPAPAQAPAPAAAASPAVDA